MDHLNGELTEYFYKSKKKFLDMNQTPNFVLALEMLPIMINILSKYILSV